MIIHGANFGNGAGKRGTEEALEVLIDNGLYNVFPRAEIKNIIYHGELPENYLKRLYEVIKSSLREERFILNIGGDHSNSIATINATCNHYKDVSVIWIDAHLDYNNVNTTITGNLHGLPLNCVVNGSKTFNDRQFLWTKQGCIAADNITMIGVRDTDPAEKEMAIKSGMRIFWMDECREVGLEKILESALSDTLDNIHLSFDVDSISFNEFSATGCECPDGLTIDEAKMSIKMIKDTGKLVSMDFVEYNPSLELDNPKKCAILCLELLKQLL
jgi:arginase